jgi:aspartyl-tRNA(Asn)/glutamyl-tRNA(Gln) amidotransferase subunit C
MSIKREEVLKVAHLARLDITDDKVDEYTKNLSNILDLIEQMNQVNTDDVLPLSNPLDAVQRLRTDVVTEVNQRELFQSVAAEVQDGLYLVPKVIE